MPYGNLWLVERRVCLCTAWGDISDEDIDAYHQDAFALVSAAHLPKLHTIYEMSGITGWPPSIAKMLRLKVNRDAKIGYTIVVGLKIHRAGTFIAVVGQLFGISQRFFDTLPQAIQFIQSADRTLPDLTALDMDAACEQARLNPMAAWLTAYQRADLNS